MDEECSDISPTDRQLITMINGMQQLCTYEHKTRKASPGEQCHTGGEYLTALDSCQLGAMR